MAIKFFDLSHPFFRPLWIRILVTGVALSWAVFEAITGEPFWAILFGSAAGWCAWSFFMSQDDDTSER